MPDKSQPSLTFHKNTFFELKTNRQTMFIDPVFSRQRRGRRVADEIRDCDYLLSTSMSPWFDDCLDVLDEGDATFVGLPRMTSYVSQELGLRKQRLLDLEPWERASDDGVRITALPILSSIGMERSIAEGASILRDVSNVFPDGPNKLPIGRNARQMVDMGLRGLTQMFGAMTNVGGQTLGGQTLGGPNCPVSRMGEVFNVDLQRFTGGRPGLGYLFELEGYVSVMHLADGIHDGTDDDDLEDIADLSEPDVLVLHVGGRDIAPYVRAVRTLAPRTVLLYRSRDPYTTGRRGQTVPMSQFVGAIEEDAPRTEVIHLRKGDAFVLDRTNGAKQSAKDSKEPGKYAALGIGAKPTTTSAPAKS